MICCNFGFCYWVWCWCLDCFDYSTSARLVLLSSVWLVATVGSHDNILSVGAWIGVVSCFCSVATGHGEVLWSYDFEDRRVDGGFTASRRVWGGVERVGKSAVFRWFCSFCSRLETIGGNFLVDTQIFLKSSICQIVSCGLCIRCLMSDESWSNAICPKFVACAGGVCLCQTWRCHAITGGNCHQAITAETCRERVFVTKSPDVGYCNRCKRNPHHQSPIKMDYSTTWSWIVWSLRLVGFETYLAWIRSNCSK